MRPMLPPEMVEHILDFVALDSATLCAASLVHTTWLPRASVHLFSHVVLDSHESISAFFKVLELPASARRLQGLVCTISIVNPIPEWEFTIGGQSEEDDSNLVAAKKFCKPERQIFKALSSIHSFTVHGYDHSVPYFQLHPFVVQLGSILANSITTLVLLDHEIRVYEHSVVLSNFIWTFPNLQFLTYIGRSNIAGKVLNSLESPGQNLCGLSIDNAHRLKASWLSAFPSTATLRTLQLVHILPTEFDAIRTYIQSRSSSLVHLCIIFSYHTGIFVDSLPSITLGEALGLHNLTRLRSLAIYQNENKKNYFSVLIACLSALNCKHKMEQIAFECKTSTSTTTTIYQYTNPKVQAIFSCLDKTLVGFPNLRSVCVFVVGEMTMFDVAKQHIYAQLPQTSLRGVLKVQAGEIPPYNLQKPLYS